MQKIFDPLAGAEKLENGTLFYRLEDKEISAAVKDENKLRELYEKIISGAEEAWEGEEDEESVRIAILEAMEKDTPYTSEEFDDVLDKELSVFLKGQKYDYVKDIKDAFKDSLSKSAADKIFDTIPDHVFWDIKKPLVADN